MGSVKDLQILKEPVGTKPGIGRFVFSDRYSVFDWGEMPDHIPDKGKAIALLGAYFFEKLEKEGIKTHYIGLIDKSGMARKLDELEDISDTMEIKLLRVIEPEYKDGKYDYSKYKEEKGNFLIPLEIIYRNYLPPGSSIFKRLKEGKITLEYLGLKNYPEPGQKLAKTILDVSTKLEATDRYITWEEAKEIAGLSEKELNDIMELTQTINSLITAEFEKIGFINEDGKIEVGFDEKRELMVVDVLGTLDECRFTYQNTPMSKEIARIYYRKTPWYEAVNEAKKKDAKNWKKYCKLQPEPLPIELKDAISNIYRFCTNAITGKEWFKLEKDIEETFAIIEKYCK